MKQEPSPQITLCIPVFNEESKIPEFLQNISSYFNKFQIPYELIFALDPSQDQSERLILEAQEKDSRIQVIKNIRHQGRARSLLRAIEKANAPYIGVLSTDLSIPLGDVTKLLQNLIDSPAVIAFGTRIDKKDSPFLTLKTPKNRLEITYMNILHEKNQRRFKDPFSSVFVLKKEAREKLLQDLKVEGWYLTPALQKRVTEENLPSIEVPVHATSGHSPHFPYYREYLRLFFWSLRQ